MPLLLNLGLAFQWATFSILPAVLASDFISSYSLLDRFPVAVSNGDPQAWNNLRLQRKMEGERQKKCSGVFWNVLRISMANHYRGHFAGTSSPRCLALVLYLW